MIGLIKTKCYNFQKRFEAAVSNATMGVNVLEKCQSVNYSILY
jgi:hypothetical protein